MMMHRVATIVAIPFLTLFGLLFLCVRTAFAMSLRVFGWELAWPPVPVGDPDQQIESSHSRSRRSRMPARQRTADRRW